MKNVIVKLNLVLKFCPWLNLFTSEISFQYHFPNSCNLFGFKKKKKKNSGSKSPCQSSKATPTTDARSSNNYTNAKQT